MINPNCYLGQHGYMEDGGAVSDCSGPLMLAHLISQQHLKRYGGNPKDPRASVPCCGGLCYVGGHHGQLDAGMRRLRLRREALPPAVEELAADLGILWLLDKNYGPRLPILTEGT